MGDFMLETCTRKQRIQQIIDVGLEIDSSKNTDSALDTLSRIPKLFLLADEVNAEGTFRERLENATEVVMDVQLIKLGHKIVGDVLQQLENSDFLDAEYAMRIRNLINLENNEIWNPIIAESALIIHTTQMCFNLLGTCDSESLNTCKVRRIKITREKVDIGIEKKPNQINKFADDKSSQKLNVIMNQINKIYSERQQLVPYYELVVDPYDFMYTIDNAFQLSFLIKDGSVAIEIGEDSLPLIRVINKTEKLQNLEKKKKHTIISFSPKLWRTMAKKYRIKKPLLNLERNDDANTSRSVDQ